MQHKRSSPPATISIAKCRESIQQHDYNRSYPNKQAIMVVRDIAPVGVGMNDYIYALRLMPRSHVHLFMERCGSERSEQEQKESEEGPRGRTIWNTTSGERDVATN